MVTFFSPPCISTTTLYKDAVQFIGNQYPLSPSKLSVDQGNFYGLTRHA